MDLPMRKLQLSLNPFRPTVFASSFHFPHDPGRNLVHGSHRVPSSGVGCLHPVVWFRARLCPLKFPHTSCCILHGPSLAGKTAQEEGLPSGHGASGLSGIPTTVGAQGLHPLSWVAFVNVSLARVIWGERLSTEKMPSSYWQSGNSVGAYS